MAARFLRRIIERRAIALERNVMESVTLKDILYIIGAITAVVAFVKLISKPYKELESKMTTQEQSINDLTNGIKAQQKLLNHSLKVQILLMEHVVYGNHTEKMKEELHSLQSEIVNEAVTS